MTRKVRTSTVDVATPVGTARLHVWAVARPHALVVLGHGAGRGVDTADLLSLAEALPLLGVGVVLLDQPWVLQGRRIAVAPPVLDRAWAAALGSVRGAAGATSRTPLVVGGRSAGARVACRTAASTGADAVLLLAYPLVPPPARRSQAALDKALDVRREELRLLGGQGIPVVALQGDRDVFGSARELARAAGRGVEVLAVPDADHALRVRRGGLDPAPRLLEGALRALTRARGE